MEKHKNNTFARVKTLGTPKKRLRLFHLVLCVEAEPRRF